MLLAVQVKQSSCWQAVQLASYLIEQFIFHRFHSVIHKNNVIGQFLERVDSLDEEYHKIKLQLVEKAHSTSKDQESEQKELEDYYKTVLFVMEQSSADTAIATQGEYMTRRDEEAKKV